MTITIGWWLTPFVLWLIFLIAALAKGRLETAHWVVFAIVELSLAGARWLP